MPHPQSADELIEFIYSSPMQELSDDEGRFLGEHIASAYDKRDDAHLSFRDPRDQTGLVANVGALRQVTGAWPVVLHLLSSDRGSAAPTLLEMLDATRTPLALIAHRWLNGQSIPPALAAAYKASVGYGQILRTWLLRGAPTTPPALHPFLAFVDAEGWLIGKDYVCPGSRRAIAEAWTVLCGDPPSDFVDELPCAESYTDEREQSSTLRDAIGAIEALFFALYSHERARASLPGEPQLGVVLQLAAYVSGYGPQDALRLSADPRVSDFVAALDRAQDPRALFASYASEALAPLGLHGGPASASLFERLSGFLSNATE